MAQYETITVTLADGSEGTYTQANWESPPHGWTGQRWYRCVVCGRPYPRSQVVLEGEKAYCLLYQHDQEIPRVVNAIPRGQREWR